MFPVSLEALRAAGPWITLVAILILLLAAVVKVLIIDQSMIPTRLFEQERERNEKVLDALATLTAADDKVLPLVDAIRTELRDTRDELRGVRRDLEELRRHVYGTSRSRR